MELEDIIRDNKDEIVRNLTASMLKSVQDSLTWQLREQIKESVGKYISEQIFPLVVAELEPVKAEMAAQIVLGVRNASAALAKSIEDKVIENIGKYGTVNDIVKKLTGGY